MTPKKPEAQILAIWRVLLAFASLVPAFLISILFRIGSAGWIAASGGWALTFLLTYLVYLPLLYRSISYTLTEDKIILTTGVFSRRIVAVPLEEVRFTSVSTTIVGRLFGLSNLTVTAAGGRIVLHGLKTRDAKALALALTP